MTVLPFTARRERPRPKHRAADRIAELTTGYEQQLTALRVENVALLTRQAAADEHFMVLDQLITGLEGDKRELQALLAAEQGARAVAEMDVETRGRWIGDLERKVADLERRLDIRGLAEAAAARTQELDVRSLRERFTAGRVVTLHHSPQAAEPEPAA